MRNKVPLINLKQNKFPDWSEFDYYDIIWMDSAEQYYHIADGDCVITKMGDHHDIVNIKDFFEAIYFETT